MTTPTEVQTQLASECAAAKRLTTRDGWGRLSEAHGNVHARINALITALETLTAANEGPDLTPAEA